MTESPLEIVEGSGNVFADLGLPDADIRQTKASMGALIIKTLNERGLSARQVEEEVGLSHSEFLILRRATFKHFTIDKLMGILLKLGYDNEIST